MSARAGALARRAGVAALLAGLGALLAGPAAHAAVKAGLSVTLRPDRAGASTALTLAFQLSGGGAAEEEDVPPPLRRLAVHLPSGLTVEARRFASCPLARLRRRGPAGCPARSLLGRGSATLEVHAGSQTLRERSTLSAIRLPDRAGQHALAVYGIGYTPLNQTSISTGTLQADRPPYGSQLVLSVPAIPTVVFEPDASFLSSSLTVGAASGRPSGPPADVMRLPRRCPPGGLPFAVDFLFAGGSGARASTLAPCPTR